ncbi:MAG: WYL domain-containing protein [Clostridiales bacterium]|uniref:helix-turn-helix transcriptional regulator n=1 Tax=Roseburia sp. MSJ-14 TaxID=2841514 RepID=UPI0016A0BDFB|nr:WYL domain-containing protein [Roseburia sp. MSJ-14]MBU5474814.1 WYL domain-containing protein [Roseburia sp. MSJ-14]NLK78884.1 WYL domain-containing protein [Clostridiales bacterium]
MAERTSQKLKLLYLMKILLQKTDETHGITMPEIISELNAYGISAERKGLYNDMECLRTYGMEIAGYQEERAYYYKVVGRQFELAELKLLVDSVQSAKFITTKKSRELIEKITGLASKYEATQLNRQVYMAERIKTKNEGIYYNVDAIYNAIAENVKITFQYFQWNIKKQMELRHDGALYQVSPWALSWDDDNYYLIAYDEKEEKIKHFRVDKMLHIEMTEEKREGRWVFKEFDIAVYARKMFGMFDGEEEMVKILCHNSLAGVMIDRFGKDISLIPVDEEHFSVTVRVAVSRQFLSWVMALGEGAKIIGPDIVVEQVKTEVERLVKQYL